MLIAMGGDLKGAEEAILGAEMVGAPADSIRMVRGLLALYRGDTRTAIDHLEKAVALRPQSVAAYSLLAEAYHADGQYDRYQTIFMNSIEKLSALTPEDYLFKGHAESLWSDPGRGLKSIDEAIRQRDSPIAHVLRSHARSFSAQDTGDVKMAQSAIDDASAAKSIMPGNPMVIWTHLWAHLVATGIFRDAGDKVQADESLVEAEKDTQELEGLPAFPKSYETRWHYFNLTGKEQAAYEVAVQGYQEADSAATRSIYMMSLYERGDFERALEELAAIERAAGAKEVSRRDAKVAGGVYWIRPFILAELPDGSSQALEAYRQNCELFTRGYDTIFNRATLLFLGHRDKAMAASKELYGHPEQLMGLGLAHYQRILAYCRGDISEEQLLKAEAGSRWNQCESHFYVALDRLAQGDRTKAREHFRKVLATGVFQFWAEYQMSRLFLKRMDRDPDWPPWIPLKETTSQPAPNPRQQ